MSEKAPSAGTWRGVPLEMLTQEELIAAVLHLANKLKRYRAPEMMDALALGQVEQFKRRIWWRAI